MFKHQPENESQSGSSNSPFDALEEEDTDDSFSRRMIREMRERNQEAVENARSARPQAFRKARPRARGRLTLENLERMPIKPNAQDLQSSQGSTRSTSSGGASVSDPPLNVPREWGKKGKRSSDWLRRIAMDPAAQTSGTATEGGVDWLQAASDVPIPSVEDSPLSHRGSMRGTPASSLRRRNDSLERIQASELIEDLDLTSNSFITSTPAVYPKNNALAEIRQREAEIGLEESVTAYATPPAEAPHRQTLGQGRLSITRAKPKETSSLESWSHPAEQDIQTTKLARREQTTVATSTTIAAGGPPSPISLHKSSYTVGTVDRAVTPTIQKNPQRPGHRREDSQDLLRRLSRATSGTPSSSSHLVNPPEPVKELPGRTDTKGKQSPNMPYSRDGVQIGAKEQAGGESGSSRVQSQSSDREDNHTKATAKLAAQPAGQTSRSLNVDETIISATTHLEAKTPLVTGAWIDTPRPAPRQEPTPPLSPAKRAAAAAALGRPRLPAGANESIQLTRPSQPVEPAGPALPSSALAAVVDEARRNLGQENAEDLGEATINSLEDIMLPLPDESLASSDEDTLDLHQALDFPPKKATTAAGKLREEERAGLRRLSETLRKTERRVREANREASRAGSRAASQLRAANAEPNLPGVLQSHCYNCTHLFRAMWTESKQLFYTHQEKKIKPTWTGWILMFLLTWFLVETIMGYVNTQYLNLTRVKACNSWFLCPPVTASEMSAFGVYVDAPRMPFVIPTYIFRPIRPLWGSAWSTASGSAHWVWNFVWYIFEENEAIAKAGGSTSRTVIESATETIVSSEFGSDWSMMNDEIV
jgi:hypothetical protein